MDLEKKIDRPIKIIRDIFFKEKTVFSKNRIHDHICRPATKGVVWTSIHLKTLTFYTLRDYNFKQNEKDNKTSY